MIKNTKTKITKTKTVKAKTPKSINANQKIGEEIVADVEKVISALLSVEEKMQKLKDKKQLKSLREMITESLGEFIDFDYWNRLSL